ENSSSIAAAIARRCTRAVTWQFCASLSRMQALKARVEGGKVIVEDEVELPDGELYLKPVDIIESLTDDELAELDAKLARGSADIEAGRMVDASEVLAKLRARREAKNL